VTIPVTVPVNVCGNGVSLLGDASSSCDPAAPTGSTGGVVSPPADGTPATGGSGTDLGTASIGGNAAGPTATLTGALTHTVLADGATPITGLASTGSPVLLMVLGAALMTLLGSLALGLARIVSPR
jgi:hypothetical protein